MTLVAGLLELAATAAAGAALNLHSGSLDVCPKGSNDAIVVCGSRERRSPYRLPKISQEYAPKRLHPEKVIPGGRIHVESEQRPDGLVDKRLMISFGLPF